MGRTWTHRCLIPVRSSAFAPLNLRIVSLERRAPGECDKLRVGTNGSELFRPNAQMDGKIHRLIGVPGAGTRQ